MRSGRAIRPPSPSLVIDTAPPLGSSLGAPPHCPPARLALLLAAGRPAGSARRGSAWQAGGRGGGLGSGLAGRLISDVTRGAPSRFRGRYGGPDASIWTRRQKSSASRSKLLFIMLRELICGGDRGLEGCVLPGGGGVSFLSRDLGITAPKCEWRPR